MWYSDGVEGEVIEDLLDRFMEDNPGHQRHPRQRRLQGHPGAAADPARGRPGPRHRPRHQPQGAGRPLARPAPPTCRTPTTGAPTSATRSTGCAPTARNAIPGFMTQLTLTGGFANKTLFEQAGVRAARRQAPPGTTGSTPPPRSPRARACRPPSPSTAPATASPARTSPTAPTTSPPDGMPAPVDDGVKDLRRASSSAGPRRARC